MYSGRMALYKACPRSRSPDQIKSGLVRRADRPESNRMTTSRPKALCATPPDVGGRLLTDFARAVHTWLHQNRNSFEFNSGGVL